VNVLSCECPCLCAKVPYSYIPARRAASEQERIFFEIFSAIIEVNASFLQPPECSLVGPGLARISFREGGVPCAITSTGDRDVTDLCATELVYSRSPCEPRHSLRTPQHGDAEYGIYVAQHLPGTRPWKNWNAWRRGNGIEPKQKPEKKRRRAALAQVS
jgi:hypothetical protein